MSIAALITGTVAESRDFPHALVDGEGKVWAIERRGSTITPVLTVTSASGQRLREEPIQFPAPANTWRNSGLDIYARGTEVVVWGYVHNTVDGTNHTFQAVVPGFVPVGTATPPPAPNPVAAGITQTQIQQMIAQALAQLPAPSQGGGQMNSGDVDAIARRVVDVLAAAAGDENHPYHQALANLVRPVDTTELANAIAGSAALYTQLNNVAGLQAWKVAIESGQIEAIGKITGTPVKVPAWVQAAIGPLQAS
jgi:hypothetical protein